MIAPESFAIDLPNTEMSDHAIDLVFDYPLTPNDITSYLDYTNIWDPERLV